MKRPRAPKAKEGELKMCWGKMPHENPDMCFAWGEGCTKRDANLLHYVMASPRNKYMAPDQMPTLVEELDKRGYDITTLKFSIKKKVE